MSALLKTSDQMLQRALGAFEQGLDALYLALDQLPAPVYVTDTSGWVIYANTACTGFSGRRPAIGKDRWCVTWKLYTEDGESLPHDQCPMAVAISQRQAIRGLSAVAERPDGTRVIFTPFPTPLLDQAGELVAAVNMLIDVTDLRQLADLQAQAERCRRLSKETWNQSVKDALAAMADECQAKAEALRGRLEAAYRDSRSSAGAGPSNPERLR